MAALIGQDYHCAVHSSTGQTPEERFFKSPPSTAGLLPKVFWPW
jgi:hypothetical protein